MCGGSKRKKGVKSNSYDEGDGKEQEEHTEHMEQTEQTE